MLPFLQSFLHPIKTGLLEDGIEYSSSLPRHELFGVGGEGFDWDSYFPPFRYQGSTMMCSAFAGTNALSAIEKRRGRDVLYSPIELYCRSNGAINGNTVSNLEAAMKVGLSSEEECPWVPSVDAWSTFILDLYRAYAKKAKVEAKEAVKSLTYVGTDRDSLRRALPDSPILAVVDVGYGYWNDYAPRVSSGSLHLVAISKVAGDGSVKIFDSLRPSKTFNGFHWLSPEYNIRHAFGIVDLPEDWQAKQAEAEQRLKAIVWKPGLSLQQRKSIESLFLGKPTSQWSLQDKANWAYATLNAPIP